MPVVRHSDGATPQAGLEKMLRRRDQLVAELQRKETILEKLRAYEREFLCVPKSCLMPGLGSRAASMRAARRWR